MTLIVDHYRKRRKERLAKNVSFRNRKSYKRTGNKKMESKKSKMGD